MNFLLKSPQMKEDFMNKALSTNQTILRVGASFALIVELLNIVRVVFFSDSGLGTLNNRIYFGLYATYFLSCIVFLLLDTTVLKSQKSKYRLYLVISSLFLLWHTFFNIYDIYKSSAVGNFTITLGLVFFVSFLVVKPIFVIFNLGVCYVLFSSYLLSAFSVGELINFSITLLLCIVIYLVRFNALYSELLQNQTLRALKKELSKAKTDFKLSAEQYELIRERVNYVSFEWNIQKDWIRFSKEWKEWFGQPQEIAAFSQFISNLEKVSATQKEQLLLCLERVKGGADYQKLELMLPLVTGEDGWFELRVVSQSDGSGNPIFGIGMLMDISDKERKIRQLGQEIQIDPFTGVFNKSAIEHYGAKKIKQLPQGEVLAMLILDIDDFKEINDTYGHPAGDAALKQVASLMQQEAPVGVRVGRIGGDEFIALFLTHNIQLFFDYGQKLVDTIHKLQWKGQEIDISCSIGIALSRSCDDDYNKLYQQADQALYKSKRQGKGNSSYYDEQEQEDKVSI